MIGFTEVTKQFGKIRALDRLTLTIPQGAVLGLLGPNGSGKSTLINLWMGFIFPNAGTIDRGGLNPFEIGYVPERPAFPPRCSANEYLAIVGKLCGMKEATLRATLPMHLAEVGLQNAGHGRIDEFSKGMLQRLALAQAVLSNPPMLVLDEPMNGLDPVGQKEIRDLIKQWRAEGKTILFSTHRLEDVSEVCTHVAMLKRGQLVRAGLLAEVLPTRAQIVITVAGLRDTIRAMLQTRFPDVTINDSTIILDGKATAQKNILLRALIDAGADIQNLTRLRPSLEEIYLEAMQ